MKRFFSRLNYSLGNEDWRAERLALKIRPCDRVFCITASGDRPLHTLLENPREVIAVDSNKIQNHLLHLKSAAIKTLDYAEYIRFLGAAPHEGRKDFLPQLCAEMDQTAAQFWMDRQTLIHRGILYQGCMESMTRLVANLACLARKKRINQLFEIDNIVDQRKFVKEHWDRPLWRKFFKFFVSSPLAKLLFGDPGLYSADKSVHVGAYIYDRILYCLNRHLAKENLLLSLIFKGKLTKEAFPPYLLPESFPVMRSRLDRLSVETSNAIEYLEKAPPDSFDVFSLSDIVSYMNEEDFKRLLRAVYRTAKEGARFSIRQFTSRRTIPLERQSAFKRNYVLEERLKKEDRSFVYQFMVGKISKEKKEEELGQ